MKILTLSWKSKWCYFSLANFEKYLSCSSTPEYSFFVSKILEECHENPKQKWVFCHHTLSLLLITTMKKVVLSVLSCKTTLTFVCLTIWWEQPQACTKLQVCQMQLNSLMGFLKKNTAKPGVSKKTLHSEIHPTGCLSIRFHWWVQQHITRLQSSFIRNKFLQSATLSSL
jgi:hypothetical protein